LADPQPKRRKGLSLTERQKAGAKRAWQTPSQQQTHAEEMDLPSILLFVFFSFVNLTVEQAPLEFTSWPSVCDVGQTYTITWSGGQSDQVRSHTILSAGTTTADSTSR